MDPHLIELPRKILVGNRVIDKICQVCEDLELTGNPLILTGLTTESIAGTRVKNELSSFNPILRIVKTSSLKEIERINEKTKATDFVVAVGGGKVIDVGKLLAFKKSISLISVPTAPSHDGIASERVSLRDGNHRYSFKARVPLAIVADVQILINAPYGLIAAGCADVIANCTAVWDWKLGKRQGEYYSDYAAALALLSAEIVLHSAELIKNKKERGIRNLIEALISSGISMSLAGSSRPASGSEHLFSHALDLLGSKALHGEQCGVGCILAAYLQEQDWKLIKNTLKLIGAPTTAKELGIEKDLVVEALLDVKNIRDRYTILNEKPLDREKAVEVCKATGVIE